MANILIAEDEPDIRELIRITLEYFGHTVTATNDGLQAVRTLEDRPFDLVVMDVRMPNMTGYEACREMRKMHHRIGTPIIFLSAKGQDREIQEGMDAGANAYLIKPFAPDQLVSKIQELLNQPVP